MTGLVGQVVEDRYRLEEEIGCGAMGMVLRARHVRVGREAAVKVLHEHLMRDPVMVERFEREAAVVARLNHKNLVNVIDVGETSGQRYIVLDLVRGPSLAAILNSLSPIFIFLACAAALPNVEPGEPLDMKAAYAQERTAFLFFFLAYQGGNWIVDLTGLSLVTPPIVYVHRTIVCAALIMALIGRSRRWDWAAMAIVAAAYALRLVTQLVQ
jgi:serine/threonine protein kinase